MSYEVTATRRRPRTFDQLVGQEFVVATLKNSIDSGRIAHAYLFSGPRGVGKTSAARILAKALNCPDGPSAAGCDEWQGSEEIARGTSLDVIEIDGASNTSVNDVREIKDEVLFAPNSSRYKIYIIDEVHMLSNSAFNALLKTIEEPPPYIIFIFATTEIHKVPATIRSRCQQFNFRLVPLELIRQMLADAATELGVTADEDALSWIAKEATGSLRDAYTLFDQVVAFSGDHIALDVIHDKLGLLGLERLNALLEAVVASDVSAALTLVDEALQGGVAVERFVIDLADYLRTLLLIAAGIERESVLGIRPDRIPDAVRTALDRHQLERANELMLALYRDLRYSVNPRFDLELAVSRLVSLRTLLTPHHLVKEIRDLQQELIHEGAFRQREAGERAEAGEAATRVPPGVASAGGVQTPADAHSAAQSRGDQRVAAPDAAAPDASTADANTPDATKPDATKPDDEAVNFDEPPRVDGLSLEQVESIIARFRTQRISVSAILARARLWRLAGDTLLIAFSDDFGANALAPDWETVQGAAMAVLGRDQLKVRIETLSAVAHELDASASDDESETSDENEIPPNVEMVRRVFRGEIVEDNG